MSGKLHVVKVIQSVCAIQYSIACILHFEKATHTNTYAIRLKTKLLTLKVLTIRDEKKKKKIKFALVQPVSKSGLQNVECVPCIVNRIQGYVSVHLLICLFTCYLQINQTN